MSWNRKRKILVVYLCGRNNIGNLTLNLSGKLTQSVLDEIRAHVAKTLESEETVLILNIIELDK